MQTSSSQVSAQQRVTPGKDYILTFRTFFDKCECVEGLVGAMTNGYGMPTVDSRDHDGVVGV